MATLGRNEFTVTIATLMLVLYTLTLSAVAQVTSSWNRNKTISNTGSVKAIGVGVYWDQNCTNPVSAIDWGILEPGSTKNVTIYIRNEGNSAVSLGMETSNWSPSNASNYIALSWDYDGSSIDPSVVVSVIFTLAVSASIEGITSFSFDITIIGSG
jgi:hypothetical protein